jgi:MATE family multidrug resistance protein
VLQVCFAAITAIGARIGPATLAANAILFNLLVFTAYILDGFSNAAEALTGEAIGRRDPASFRHSVFAAGRGAFIGGLVLTLVFWVAGPAIIDLMTTVPEVRAETREYLIWAIAMPMVSVWSFLYDGIFIGSTWTRAMRDGMILSAIGYVALLALFVPVWGNHGLWLAVSLFMASRALTLALRYPRLSRTVGTAPH